MKLLLDENLSRRLVPELEPAYPGTTQVVLVGLERATDRELWNYAKQHGFVLVSKDSDFHELCLIQGPPPQLVWLKCGNMGREAITRIFLDRQADIEAALARPDVAFVEIV
ncbi:MAG TPA: hypothetical protein ENO16_06300, partial [Chromatiales bacterium]|nr:hypothetical protein [Chromatiales bacterium]